MVIYFSRSNMKQSILFHNTNRTDAQTKASGSVLDGQTSILDSKTKA